MTARPAFTGNSQRRTTDVRERKGGGGTSIQNAIWCTDTDT